MSEQLKLLLFKTLLKCFHSPLQLEWDASRLGAGACLVCSRAFPLHFRFTLNGPVHSHYLDEGHESMEGGGGGGEGEESRDCVERGRVEERSNDGDFRL